VGGTESQSLFLGSKFQEKKDKVWILTNRPGGSLCHRLQEYHLTHIALQRRDWGLNWFSPGVVRVLKEIRPDVVLLMGRNANAMGFRIQKSLPSASVLSTYRTGRKLTHGYWRSLHQAPRIFCNSQFAADRLRELGINDERIEVHPNSCMRAKELEGDFSGAFSTDNGPLKLLYVAAFVPGKNHRGLIEMLPGLLEKKSDIQLSLVGEGPLLKSYKSLVEVSKLGANVEFLGYRKDLPTLLRNTDIVISTSLEESMPNALVEAQYAGKPVVAYDVAGVKECLVPGVTGFLIEPGDRDAFCAAVMSLAQDKGLLEKMSRQSAKFAKETFEPNLRFDAFYASVLKCSQSG